MRSHRHDRAESTLQRELSRIISQEVRDPDACEVRVSKVSLSADKRIARVQVAPWDPKPRREPDPRPLQALVRSTPFIRKQLARAVRMRHVPDLEFSYDRSEEYSQRIESLLDRIHKRARKGGMAALAALALQIPAPVGASSQERFESSAEIMGSEFRIACYATSRKVAAGAVTAAFDEVRRIDAFLSNYKPASELSRINAEAAKRPVAISDEMAALLEQCQAYSAASKGGFDVTVGALVKAWGFYKGQGSRPMPWTLWLARRNSGYQYLELDAVGRTVRFLRSGLTLDPGGIGKGYAVDRAVATLRDYGIERALVSSGTSSIFAIGGPPEAGGGWSLDIRGPKAEGEAAITVTLKNEALSTSGSYEKFFEDDGTRYGHILDPRTGRPATGLSAVSVIAPRTIDTEAWSTALFVNGESWARAHPVPNARVFLCRDDGSCGWLGRD